MSSTKAMNYYFNEKGEYCYSLSANKDSLAPSNAVRFAPELKEGFWPVLNEAKDAWEFKEDHRQKKNEFGNVIEDSGTPYWLPGDTQDSPARYRTELGVLPSGAILVQPSPTAREIKQLRLEEIDQQLDELDASAHRALLELADPTTSSEDRVYCEAKITELNKTKQPLRAERSTLAAGT